MNCMLEKFQLDSPATIYAGFAPATGTSGRIMDEERLAEIERDFGGDLVVSSGIEDDTFDLVAGMDRAIKELLTALKEAQENLAAERTAHYLEAQEHNATACALREVQRPREVWLVDASKGNCASVEIEGTRYIIHPLVADLLHQVSLERDALQRRVEALEEAEHFQPQERVLVVWDGQAWFARRVRVIEHDLDKDEKVYRCDQPIRGAFSTVAAALAALGEG